MLEVMVTSRKQLISYHTDFETEEALPALSNNV